MAAAEPQLQGPGGGLLQLGCRTLQLGIRTLQLEFSIRQRLFCLFNVAKRFVEGELGLPTARDLQPPMK